MYFLSCATDETKHWLSLQNSAEISFTRPPPVYLDLGTRNDWPVKKAIAGLPIRLKENS